MKKASAENYAQALELREAGKNQREIMEITGLNLSQAERFFWAVDIAKHGGFLAQPESHTAKAAAIAAMREAGQSWGLISVRYQEPESRTRKHFKEASGLNSKGMRIGKGGRYVADDVRFYQGADRAKLGTELAPGPIMPQVPADPDAQPVRQLPAVAAGVAAEAPKAKRAPRAKKVTA